MPLISDRADAYVTKMFGKPEQTATPEEDAKKGNVLERMRRRRDGMLPLAPIRAQLKEQKKTTQEQDKKPEKKKLPHQPGPSKNPGVDGAAKIVQHILSRIV